MIPSIQQLLTNQTLSELSVLLLLVITCGRIFFIAGARSDPIAILPLIALFTAILNVLAWGLSIQELTIALLAFFVFFWNVRALLRLNTHLIIDHYSVKFILASLLNLLLALIVGGIIFFLRPVAVDAKKYDVAKASQEYCGDFDKGFHLPVSPAEKKTVFLTSYSPVQAASPQGHILFIPGDCSTTRLYEPFLIKLAHDGYIVTAAEFFNPQTNPEGTWRYSRLARRFSLCGQRLYRPELYERWRTGSHDRTIKEYTALHQLVSQEDQKVFLVGDDTDKDALKELLADIPNVAGCYDVSDIGSYDTPGYGMVAQTNPLMATLFLGKKKDKSLYLPSHIATVLEESMAAPMTIRNRADIQKKRGPASRFFAKITL